MLLMLRLDMSWNDDREEDMSSTDEESSKEVAAQTRRERSRNKQDLLLDSNINFSVIAIFVFSLGLCWTIPEKSVESSKISEIFLDGGHLLIRR